MAFKKIDGTIVGEYIVPNDSPYLSALTGMFVTGGAGATNPVVYWVESGNLMGASLVPATNASPSASGSPGLPSSPGPGASTK
jgi:hypothetical protein